MLGHGVKHQLQVQAFRLHQLLPLEWQHRARVLSHLRGQFTRFLKRTEGQRGADLRRNGGDGVKGVQTHWGEASVFKSPRRFHNNGHAGRSDMSSGERHTSGEQGVHAVAQEESLTPL